MKYLKIIPLIFVALLVADVAVGQGCSQCKLIAAQGAELDENSFGSNINYGIFILMSIPYILIFALFHKRIFAFFKSLKKTKSSSKSITIEESYELFIETLSRLSERNLDMKDDDLAHEIFEELDSDSHTFLHQWTVGQLIQKGLIPKLLRPRILSLRENIRRVMDEKHQIDLYRNDPEWKELRIEASALLKEIISSNNNKS